jgi:hypothetical protein
LSLGVVWLKFTDSSVPFASVAASVLVMTSLTDSGMGSVLFGGAGDGGVVDVDVDVDPKKASSLTIMVGSVAAVVVVVVVFVLFWGLKGPKQASEMAIMAASAKRRKSFFESSMLRQTASVLSVDLRRGFKVRGE